MSEELTTTERADRADAEMKLEYGRAVSMTTVRGLLITIDRLTAQLAGVRALADGWATEGHAVLPVRNPTGQDYADDLLAVICPPS